MERFSSRTEGTLSLICLVDLRARVGQAQCAGHCRHWCQGRSTLRPWGGRSPWRELRLCSRSPAPGEGGGPGGGGGGQGEVRTSCREEEEGDQGAGAGSLGGGPCPGSRASEIYREL